MNLHRSTAWPLAWVALALVVYASLHPWFGWHWPVWAPMNWVLPSNKWETRSDMISNLLGYLPLGFLWCLAFLGSRWRPWYAAIAATAACSGLSYAMELIQFTLPGRVPSMSDWTLNSLGAGWGALTAMVVQAMGVVEWWQKWREKWLIPDAGIGLVLLWMWPLGLLYPLPLPLAQGQLLPTLQWWLVDVTANTSWQHWFLPAGDALDAMINARWVQQAMFASESSSVFWSQPVREGLIVTLGLLAPLAVACALTNRKSVRLVLMFATVVGGFLVNTLSAAMNFGPEHALVWLTPSIFAAWLAGSLLGAWLIERSRTVAGVAGLIVLLALIYFVHQLPADPYYADNLQTWERGRFIRFHGLSRWFGLLWPYVAILWFSGRLLVALPKRTKQQPTNP